jgi:hypothetical protein
MLRGPALVCLLMCACPKRPSQSAEVLFSGMCDASGAVPLAGGRFLVADDEDNVLRTYDSARPGAPVSQVDVSEFLGAKVKKKGAAETDLEAATRIGDRAYFITSHALSSAGKYKPERFRFFATSAPAQGKPQPVGKPYEGLLADLLAEPQLARFDLARAAELPPKVPGGFNIEGMVARNEGGVWLGFRNPLPQGRALLVPLLNPEDLVQGGHARFGEPLTLDLGGLGIRALGAWQGRYLIAAGRYDSGGVSRLLEWDGKAAVRDVPGAKLDGYNPEAFFVSVAQGRLLLLSDDGSRQVDGEECKSLRDGDKKGFRGLWLALPQP